MAEVLEETSVPVTETNTPIDETKTDPSNESTKLVHEPEKEKDNLSPVSASGTTTSFPDPSHFQEKVERLISGMQESKSVPTKMKEFMKKYDISKKVGKLAYYGAAAYPKVDAGIKYGYKKWQDYEKYDPQDLIPAFVGFFMAFFGGCFMVTIAAYEAFRGSGAYGTTMQAIEDIKLDFNKVMEQNKKDDELDEDGNGIPDTQEMTNDQLFKRKVHLILKSVDPKRVTNALGSIYTGFLAVVATLKIQFARALALGNSIGEVVTKPVLQYGKPKMDEFVPAEFQKWNEPVLEACSKILSVCIAWYLQRVISTVHSAVKGGSIFAESLLNYLIKKEYYKLPEGTSQKETEQKLSAGVTILGVLFQFYMGWGLIFPLNILLLPATLLEYFLSYFVAK